MRQRNLLNLNSLTDIISNSVGILIMFAVLNIIYEQQQIYKIEVPIEHRSELAPVFFICKDDAIVHLDKDHAFKHAIHLSSQEQLRDGQWFSLDYYGLDAEISEETFSGMIIHPSDTSDWETLDAVDQAHSDIRNVLDQLDNTKHYAYFFVYDQSLDNSDTGSGFNPFRKARDYLQARDIKVGWRPVDLEHPPHICSWWGHAECVYNPAYGS